MNPELRAEIDKVDKDVQASLKRMRAQRAMTHRTANLVNRIHGKQVMTVERHEILAACYEYEMMQGVSYLLEASDRGDKRMDAWKEALTDKEMEAIRRHDEYDWEVDDVERMCSKAFDLIKVDKQRERQ